MKLAFITSPVTATDCSITITKASRTDDGVRVVLNWTRPKQSAPWETGKVNINCFQDEIKTASNVLLEIYRRFGEASLYGEEPATLMHKLEKHEAVQVVVVGNEQVDISEAANAKAVYAPAGCTDIQSVQADDEEDARSTLKRRMSRMMESETGPRLEQIAKWFSGGCKVVRTSAEKPVAISQGDYLVGKVSR